MSHIRDMTRGRPAALIFAFAMPLMFGNIFQQMYTMVDTLVVGRFVGLSALAALGAADWIFWLILSSVIGYTHGFSILISQHYGGGRPDLLRRSVTMSILLSMVIAVVVTAISLPLVRPVLRLLNTPAEIIDGSARYLHIILSGIVVMTAYNMLSAILRALGDSRTPLVAMIIAALLNITLDLVFVLWLEWGITGVAVATLIAQVVAASFCFYAVSQIPELQAVPEEWRPDRHIMKQLLKLGSPLALQNIIIAVGGMVVQSVINTFGVVFVAGYTATMKLYGLLELAATAYGFGMSTYTGQNLGARNFERIHKGLRAALVMAILTAIIISVLILMFGSSLLSLFISGEPAETAEAIEIASHYLRIMGIWLFILYALHIYRSALQGMGDTVVPMISGFIELVMRISIVLFLPLLIGRRGVYYAEVGAWAGAAVILIITYYYRLHRLEQTSQTRL